MLFNSIDYIIFFPAVAIIYYCLPHAFRWAWLLASSCFFYMMFAPWFIIPLLVPGLFVYGMAFLIGRGTGRQGLYFGMGLAAPLVLLALFKYSPFFDSAIAQAATLLHLNYPHHIIVWIVPAGISYYTLHCISYIVDVRRRSCEPERHAGIFILYLVFFPKIIAGPIERPHLLDQFRERHPVDYRMITGGLKLMALGYFKKLVIADRAGMIVNEVYGHPEHYLGVHILLATLLFALQIYADFSGYTDIARGSAGVLGFRLTENFNRPYASLSLPDFWRRWHISLTSWLRDYVYIPMGGNRVPAIRRYCNIFITFLASGLWHGAGMTYIAWGGLHGLSMIAGMVTMKFRDALARMAGLDRLPRLHALVRTAVTCALVCFAWTFFRAESLAEAFALIHRIADGTVDVIAALFNSDTAYLKTVTDIARKNTILGFSRETYRPEILVLSLSTAGLWFINKIGSAGNVAEALSKYSVFFRWLLYSLLIVVILYFGMFTQEQFIYFRF
jgi:alginate O-acetyltransferase complex protein AlgI